MHYLIFEVGGPTDARIYTIEPRPPLDWRGSTPLLSPLPRVRITVNRLAYVGDLRRAESEYLIGSTRLVDILRALGDRGVEDYPLDVVDFCSGERDELSFRVLRLLGDIPCLDVDETAWAIDRSGNATRTRPVLFDDGRVPPDRHLFLMRERPSVLVATAELKERWDIGGLKGPTFEGLDGPLRGW